MSIISINLGGSHLWSVRTFILLPLSTRAAFHCIFIIMFLCFFLPLHAQSSLNWKLDYWFELSSHTLGINSLACSKSGDLLVSAGNDKTVNIWKVSSGLLYRTFKLGHPIANVALSPNNFYLAVSSPSGQLQIIDIPNNRIVKSFIQGGDPVTSLAFTLGGTYMLSASYNGSIQLWDMQTFRKIRLTPKAHQGPIYAIAVDNTNSLFCTVGGDSRVRLWKISSGSLLRSYLIEKSVLKSVTFSPDSKSIICGDDNGLILELDSETGSLKRKYEGHDAVITAIAFSQDGRHMITSSWDQTLRLWNVETGKELFSYDQRMPVTDVVVLPDSASTVISSGWNRKVIFWKIKRFKTSTVSPTAR